MNQPKATDLAAAALKISNLLFEMDRQLHAEKMTTYDRTMANGLLASFINSPTPPAFSRDIRAETHAEIRSIPAVQWLTRQIDYMSLKRAFENAAKAAPSSEFAKPDAIWHLASCTLSSLYLLRWYREKGFDPLEMSKDDWLQATDAVKKLISLRRAKGLDVSKVFFGDDILTGLPLDWESKALERLELALHSARKPCTDGKVAERRALKSFALSLYRRFGSAPLLVVTEFGSLIKYSPGSIKRNIPLWIEEERALPLLV